MNALVFALALFGCSDDATHCERLSDKAQDFASRARCEISIGEAFETDAVRRADYPTIVARCVPKEQWLALGNRPVDLSRPAIRLAAWD